MTLLSFLLRDEPLNQLYDLPQSLAKLRTPNVGVLFCAFGFCNAQNISCAGEKELFKFRKIGTLGDEARWCPKYRSCWRRIVRMQSPGFLAQKLMNIKPGTTIRLVTEPLTRALIIVGLCLGLAEAMAKPRTPLPPMPEMAPVLWHEDFDELYCYTNTSDQISVPGFGELVAGWSGYALQRSGMLLNPLIVPGLDSGARLLLATNAGAIRFWVTPYWSSVSVPGGTGPGIEARLVEFAAAGNNQVAVCWSLQASPDGNALVLIGQTDAGQVELLRAGIAWQANQPHLLCLDYGSQGTALLIDGQLCASGASTLVVPPQTGRLAIGSSFAGTEAAECAFDEIHTFGRPLGTNDLAFYYGSTRRQAALGPITEEEQAARRAARLSGTSTLATMSVAATAGPPSPEDDPAPTSEGTAEPFPPAYNYPSNSFWVEMVSATNNLASVVLRGTVQDMVYEILSRETLTNTGWVSEGTVLGASGQNWTPATVAIGTRTNSLFLCARSWVDSDGNGLPDWWELQYFPTIGVDPYSMLANDGWTTLQKYQSGWNPTNAYTPSAPTGLAARYISAPTNLTVTWNPSPGPVRAYVLERSIPELQMTDYFTNLAGTTVFQDTSFPAILPLLEYAPPSYRLMAYYDVGYSSWSGSVSIYKSKAAIEASLIRGPLGNPYLAVSALPSDTVAVRVLRYYYNVWYEIELTTYDVPVSSITNGLFALPEAWGVAFTRNATEWRVQAVDADGQASDATWLGDLKTTPFFDGREELQQNLAFLLRAANGTTPFNFTWKTPGNNEHVFCNPTNYAYSSLFTLGCDTSDPLYQEEFSPFILNHLYRNFVFPPTNLTYYGFPATGIVKDTDVGYRWLQLENPLSYLFELPTSRTDPSALLAPDQPQWILSYPFSGVEPEADWNLIGLAHDPFHRLAMFDAWNLFGLHYLSTQVAWGSNVAEMVTLTPGQSASCLAFKPWFYSRADQPQLETFDYYFANIPPNFPNDLPHPVPGMPDFSPTNTTPLLCASIGTRTFRVAGYAKQRILNGDTNKFAYLGQYFEKAYKIDTNGLATSAETGVLSPYGEFFPTEPGPVALVTMTNWGVNERGTGVVHAIKLQLDVNHDGNMDLSFAGPDNTSQNRPFVFWVNNDRDLVTSGMGVVPDDDGHDVTLNGVKDYELSFIASRRDLEDYARLWICGVPALTSGGYQVSLSWASISSGNPSIKLFKSAETNTGGIGYLTVTNIAALQTTWGTENGDAFYHSLGTISPNQSVTFGSDFFTNGATKYFLFDGCTVGSGQLVLTVSQGTPQGSNVIAQTSAWLDLHDVRDFYERAVITNNMSGAKSNWTSGVQIVEPASSSGLCDDTNLIVLVHGINVRPWDCLQQGDTVFKRLYWAGFHGRFATVKWPCNLLTPIPDPLTPANFNESEFQGYKASTALTSYLGQLRARFPGYRLNLLVHSQGNAVVSEAILKGGVSFDTYILTQGALPDSSYDVNAPTNADLVSQEHTGNYTPDWQPMGYHGAYTNLPGRIVNFYNPLDKVLGFWISNQKLLKPSVYFSTAHYFYDGTNSHFYPFVGPGYLVTDSEESRAMVARSRTDPIGRSGPASGHGVIQSAVNLNLQYGFNGDTSDEHSAQWTRPIQTSRAYYLQVLDSIKP